MNFYPFHVGDYTLRTAHLDLLEDLAYRRLLDLYYTNESPISGTAESIARLIRMKSNHAEVAVVLGEFFKETPEGWRHAHCDEVIAQYQAKAKTAAENGKRGGRPKKQTKPEEIQQSNQTETENNSEKNPEITQSVILANPEKSESKTNQEPITNNQEPVLKDHVDPVPESTIGLTDDLFNLFWSGYPVKQNKRAANKALAKFLSGKSRGRCLFWINAIVNYRQYQLDLGEFSFTNIHAASLINAKRWDDNPIWLERFKGHWKRICELSGMPDGIVEIKIDLGEVGYAAKVSAGTGSANEFEKWRQDISGQLRAEIAELEEAGAICDGSIISGSEDLCT